MSTHTHTHEHTQEVLSELAHIEGHIVDLRAAVEAETDLKGILAEISSVSEDLTLLGKIILKDHMEHCIVEAVAEDDHEAIDRMGRALSIFLR